MPDWEKIEYTRKSLKRKETYNEFGRKVRFEPLKSIPKLSKNVPVPNSVNEYKNLHETLVWKENHSVSGQTSEFVKLAQDKGFNEEQALHILQFNNFDTNLSECDLEIYQPRAGLRAKPVKEVVNKIVDKIKSGITNHQNRDLNLILMEFPGNTMGELLDFYSNNRMTIKRKTVKSKAKATTGSCKEDLSGYLVQMDPSLCGNLLYQYFYDKDHNEPDENICLIEMLNLNQDKLDKYLTRFSRRKDYKVATATAVSGFDGTILTKLERSQTAELEGAEGGEEIDDDDDDEKLSERLESLLQQLEQIETWMKPAEDHKSPIRHKWNNMDIGLFLLGLHRFGTDFDLIADAISTKTRAMVESFYLMFKDKYRLGQIGVHDAD